MLIRLPPFPLCDGIVACLQQLWDMRFNAHAKLFWLTTTESKTKGRALLGPHVVIYHRLHCWKMVCPRICRCDFYYYAEPLGRRDVTLPDMTEPGAISLCGLVRLLHIDWVPNLNRAKLDFTFWCMDNIKLYRT